MHTDHFLWTVDTRDSELVLSLWRHRCGQCGLLLCGFWSVFGGTSRSGQRHHGASCSCHDRRRRCRLSGSCGHRGGGGTGRNVTGWSFTFALNTIAHSRLGYVWVSVSTKAARAVATVLSALWVGTCPRTQLHQTLLSICWTWFWCLHGFTGC